MKELLGCSFAALGAFLLVVTLLAIDIAISAGLGYLVGLGVNYLFNLTVPLTYYMAGSVFLRLVVRVSGS